MRSVIVGILKASKKFKSCKVKVTYVINDNSITKSHLWTNSRVRNYFRPSTTKTVSAALLHHQHEYLLSNRLARTPESSDPGLNPGAQERMRIRKS
jgi:hypothetical protein